MSFADRLRAFFSRRGNPALKTLEQWAATHKGVEGYIEPLTATNPTTLLLVDRHGANVRAPVRDPEEAAAFCAAVGIPVYDAQVIGYPKRMRDFARRAGGSEEHALDEAIADLERRLREDPPKEGP